MNNGKKLQVIWLHYSIIAMQSCGSPREYDLTLSKKTPKRKKMSNADSNPASFLKQVFTSLLS